MGDHLSTRLELFDRSLSDGRITDGYARTGPAMQAPCRLCAGLYIGPSHRYKSGGARPVTIIFGWSPPWIEQELATLDVSPHPGADGLVQDERAVNFVNPFHESDTLLFKSSFQ